MFLNENLLYWAVSSQCEIKGAVYGQSLSLYEMKISCIKMLSVTVLTSLTGQSGGSNSCHVTIDFSNARTVDGKMENQTS